MGIFDIHVFENLNEYSSNALKKIVFDENSLCLFEADILIVDLINNYTTGSLENIKSELNGKYNDEDIENGLNLIEYLRKHNILKERKRNLRKYNYHLSNIVLNVSHACQLACRYCYGDGGSYKMDIENKHMSLDVAKKSLELIDENSRRINISFFGGEPLLNWSLVEEVVELAKEKFELHKGKGTILFEITTNGYDLTIDRARFLKQNNFKINISIDGEESLHNYLRPSVVSAENSWEKTMTAIMMLKKIDYNSKKISFRPTVTRLNMDIDKLYNYLDSLLPGSKKNMQIVMSPNNKELEFSDVDFLNYYTQSKELIEKGEIKKCKHAFDIYTKLRMRKYSDFTCGMGTNVLTIAPNGEAYPCYRLMGVEDFNVGNVYDGVDKVKAISYAEKYNVQNSEICSRCWLRNMCTMGCYAENYFYNSDLYIPRKDKCKFNKRIALDIIKQILKEKLTITLGNEE